MSTRGRSLLSDRAGLDDIRSCLGLVLLEVLVEELAQLDNLLLEAISAGGPGLGRVEQLRRNIGAGLGNLQVEDFIVLVFNLGEFARVHGIENGARILQWATLAALGSTSANPTGVEQPGIGLVRLNLVCQHLGVAHGVQSQEGLGEARGEGSLGLKDSVLGASHFGGIAGDEVEHDLLAGELRDRRQHTPRVAGEQDDVARVVRGKARNLSVLDVLDGVGAASVLGQSRVIIVNDTSIRIEDDILQNGAKLHRVEDIRLLLGGETDALGVATALDVEDTVVTPAVLVVTNQLPVGVGRQCRLSSPRQAEEQGHVTLLTLVCRGVKGEHVVLHWHLVEENREDALLHLTGVFGAENYHLLLGEVESNGGTRCHALGELVGRERASIVDGVVGLEALQLLTRRADEHVAHEESMIGAGADDPHANAISLVPTGISVNNVDTASCVEVVDSTFAINLPDL